ncbi:MAG TPA: hypothetical protein PKC69_01835 [Chitinophagaceae bacterium]|nr:hypothetical protein [Chitinophagaceae bacterium]
MKSFKLFDLWIQATITALTVVYILTTSVENFILLYFFIGGWQVISTLVHLAHKGRYTAAKDRKYYQNALFVTVILAVVSLPFWIFFGFALLFVSPFMAVWYWSICYHEKNLLFSKDNINYEDSYAN